MGWYAYGSTSRRPSWSAPGGLFVRWMALSACLTAPVRAKQCDTDAVIPDYVMDHAPLVWIHSEDPYNPSSYAEQVAHTVPKDDYVIVEGGPDPLNLDNLDQLNDLGGNEIYLTSKEGIRALPSWFEGVRPDDDGRTGDATASAIVVTDHGDGTVDAFYFYFYAYNQGNTVIGIQFGNHVGDWEHNMIRFKDGQPDAVWYSQHASGQAFKWDTLEKKDGRPLGWSGNGTHATYASSGPHDHTIPGLDLPFGFLVDQTDDGALWDPTLNAYSYSYDRNSKTFTACESGTPVHWLQFNGQWGDEQLPDDAEGQVDIFGQHKYTSGPNGPKFKGLDRDKVCPDGTSVCVVWPFMTRELSDSDTAEAHLQAVVNAQEGK